MLAHMFMIHASLFNCTKRILSSPSTSLFKLHISLAQALGLDPDWIDHHHFSSLDQIETCFETICPQQDDFLIPVSPGVYIEHSHPHEPLPSFSISHHHQPKDWNEAQAMSFRILRDERHVILSSLNTSSLLYWFEYNHHSYCVQLKFKPSNKIQRLSMSDNNKELAIQHACQLQIDRLLQERTLFLNQQAISHNKECSWIEYSGQRCLYCTFQS
ncbi:hypothetical protein BD560DRAFT_414896 [Blakeslea trispora]|nr:hypothetical protein BD560DRAFT_414896 [Blakeslea trispora]